MSLSDASSELSPSLAELTAPTVVVTTAATTDQPAPDRADRPVFPVRILGPTNSPNQAPTNRHDEDDVDTPHQQSNVTLRSSDANTNSHQQTRPNSNAQRDDDDGGVDPRRRIDLPPLCLLRSRGRDSYDNRTQRGYPLEGDVAGVYPPTLNQQSGSEDGGDDNCYDNHQRSDNNQHHDDYRQYHDDDRYNNGYQRSNNDNRQYDSDNPNRDNRRDTFRRHSDNPQRNNRKYEDSRRNNNSNRVNYSTNNRDFDNFRDDTNDNFLW